MENSNNGSCENVQSANDAKSIESSQDNIAFFEQLVKRLVKESLKDIERWRSGRAYRWFPIIGIIILVVFIYALMVGVHAYARLSSDVAFGSLFDSVITVVCEGSVLFSIADKRFELLTIAAILIAFAQAFETERTQQLIALQREPNYSKGALSSDAAYSLAKHFRAFQTAETLVRARFGLGGTVLVFSGIGFGWDFYASAPGPQGSGSPGLSLILLFVVFLLIVDVVRQINKYNEDAPFTNEEYKDLVVNEGAKDLDKKLSEMRITISKEEVPKLIATSTRRINCCQYYARLVCPKLVLFVIGFLPLAVYLFFSNSSSERENLQFIAYALGAFYVVLIYLAEYRILYTDSRFLSKGKQSQEYRGICVLLMLGLVPWILLALIAAYIDGGLINVIPIVWSIAAGCFYWFFEWHLSPLKILSGRGDDILKSEKYYFKFRHTEFWDKQNHTEGLKNEEIRLVRQFVAVINKEPYRLTKI
ncbi:MAG: hypothetical protein Q4P66_08830 [Actinomycetaceae bacterium]|nr:hypothetical protein [Actinomycetaceae bacterium]